MAALYAQAQSPWDGDRTSLRMHIGNPITPVHSPHHSLTSSVSARTPIHTLTIHEYRKQQQTPTPAHKATPPGRTLRRKPATPALNHVERAASVPPQQQSHYELPFRALSTGPHQPTGSISSTTTTSSLAKVRFFNPRKRLPRPPATTGSAAFPSPSVHVKSAQTRPPLPSTLSLSTEHARSVDTQTTTVSSSYSLSQFPQPPRQTASPLSPLKDEEESVRIHSQSFAATHPATPPATPAIIHYRGTSFDLVNPHDSLLLHDIVTPPRDFDSGDYFPVPTSDDEFSEMAPKRAVYGDFAAAHAGILRRPEESCADIPAPPTPAALSPNSSSYTSPMYSPESADTPSPLFTKKAAPESRFSIKGLTRSLTQKLGKGPTKPQEQELQDMRNRNVSTETISMDLDFPRSLQPRVSMPETAYAPVGVMPPTAPASSMSRDNLSAFSPEQQEAEISQKYSAEHYDTQPLASMLPDDENIQTGQRRTSQLPHAEGDGLAKPYYDDADSIYPSSSIYTGDGRRASHIHNNLMSNRNSNGNPFARYSSASAGGIANGNYFDSVRDYTDLCEDFDHASRPYDQGTLRDLAEATGPEADTTNNLIDEYNPHDTTETTLPRLHEETTAGQSLNSLALAENRKTSEIAFDEQSESALELERSDFSPHQRSSQTAGSSFSRRSAFSRSPGLPPRAPLPLAPPFGYDEMRFSSLPDIPDLPSDDSGNSYGDTRDLLRVSLYGDSLLPTATQTLEPSSSYSQPGLEELGPSSSNSQMEAGSSTTPKEALDQAEQIFQDTVGQPQSDNEIPAMWSRRNSGGQLLNKSANNTFPRVSDAQDMTLGDEVNASAEDRGDWETVAGNSRDSKGHESLDSIADYSSSEGTRNSLGLDSHGSLPSWVKQTQSPARSGYYHYPSPILTPHSHPFRSTPPQLSPHLDTSVFQLRSNQAASDAPAFQHSAGQDDTLARRPDPYAFSAKETEELLASGPNDKIIIEEPSVGHTHQSHMHQQHQNQNSTSGSSTQAKERFSNSSAGQKRENMFEMLSSAGSRSDITATVDRTGMHKTGSSTATSCKRTVRLSPAVGRQSVRSNDNGFYAAPYPATGSVTRIRQPGSTYGSRLGLTPSETTLFPSSYALKQAQEASSPLGSHQHLGSSTTFVRNHRRASRSAVPGQTKLREMFLASDARSIASTQRTNVTRVMGGYRPSTSDTITPLRRSRPGSDMYQVRSRSIADRYSPRLLCVERTSNAEDEAQRRRLSWLIFACFCVLPPCIILFRFMGDSIISAMTEGQLGHCTPQSKRMALIAGIAVNVGLVTVILVPVLVVHALNGA